MLVEREHAEVLQAELAHAGGGVHGLALGGERVGGEALHAHAGKAGVPPLLGAAQALVAVRAEVRGDEQAVGDAVGGQLDRGVVHPGLAVEHQQGVHALRVVRARGGHGVRGPADPERQGEGGGARRGGQQGPHPARHASRAAPGARPVRALAHARSGTCRRITVERAGTSSTSPARTRGRDPLGATWDEVSTTTSHVSGKSGPGRV